MNNGRDKKRHSRNSKYTQLAYTLFLQEKRAQIVNAQVERYDVSLLRPCTHSTLNDSIINLDLISKQILQMWKDQPKRDIDKYRARAMMEMKRRRVEQLKSPLTKGIQACQEVEGVQQEESICLSTLTHEKIDWNSDESNITFTSSKSKFDPPIDIDVTAFHDTRSGCNVKSYPMDDLNCEFSHDAKTIEGANPISFPLPLYPNHELQPLSNDILSDFSKDMAPLETSPNENYSNMRVAADDRIFSAYSNQMSAFPDPSSAMGYIMPNAVSPGKPSALDLTPPIFHGSIALYNNYQAHPTSHPVPPFQCPQPYTIFHTYNHGYQPPYASFGPYRLVHPPYPQPLAMSMAVPTPTPTPPAGFTPMYGHVVIESQPQMTNNIHVEESERLDRLDPLSYGSPMPREQKK